VCNSCGNEENFTSPECHWAFAFELILEGPLDDVDDLLAGVTMPRRYRTRRNVNARLYCLETFKREVVPL
jgi:hypothetical protein